MQALYEPTYLELKLRNGTKVLVEQPVEVDPETFDPGIMLPHNHAYCYGEAGCRYHDDHRHGFNCDKACKLCHQSECPPNCLIFSN